MRSHARSELQAQALREELSTRDSLFFRALCEELLRSLESERLLNRVISGEVETVTREYDTSRPVDTLSGTPPLRRETIRRQRLTDSTREAGRVRQTERRIRSDTTLGQRAIPGSSSGWRGTPSGRRPPKRTSRRPGVAASPGGSTPCASPDCWPWPMALTDFSRNAKHFRHGTKEKYHPRSGCDAAGHGTGPPGRSGGRGSGSCRDCPRSSGPEPGVKPPTIPADKAAAAPAPSNPEASDASGKAPAGKPAAPSKGAPKGAKGAAKAPATVRESAAQRIAREVFRSYPDRKTVHVASDGTAFFNRSDAVNYGRTLKDTTVVEVTNQNLKA